MSKEEDNHDSEMKDDITEDLFESTQLGDGINWNSELILIEFTVELPYWLMTPSATFDLTIEDCTIRAKVINEGIHYMYGYEYFDSGQRTIFIGRMQEALEATVPMSSIPGGIIMRPTKTLIAFQTVAHSDALDALACNSQRRHNSGILYFRSLAIALILFLNKLVNSYRIASNDPFAIEVNACDVPTWYLKLADRNIPIQVFTYSSWDFFPTVGPFSKPTERTPFYAASSDEVQTAIKSDEIPGLFQILDGWSLFFRGRHAESIISFVTAIETLLESKLREVLRKLGTSADKIEKLLFETRAKFFKRFNLYCELAQIRPPGPWINALPHLNGLRLADELDRTRDARHRIVHAGTRLEFNLTGPMMRSAETTTWLFNWLLGGDQTNYGQGNNYTFFQGVRGVIFLPYALTDKGLIIQPQPPWSPIDASNDQYEETDERIVHSADPGDNPVGMFWKSLGGLGKPSDIETFTLLALAKLKLYNIEDSPLELSLAIPHKDRFRFKCNEKLVLVFLIDRDGFLEHQDIEQIAATVGLRTRQGLLVASAICVINDQRFIPFDQRNHDSLPASCLEIAEAYRVSMVKSEDLARVALASRELGWDPKPIIEDLLEPGRRAVSPLGSQTIGKVVDFYARPRAAIIDLNGQVEVVVGDTLIIRCGKRYVKQSIESMQQDSVAVERAKYGEIGIVVDTSNAKLKGCEVFLLPK